jgi:PAS domain S-box-containing protein
VFSSIRRKLLLAIIIPVVVTVCGFLIVGLTQRSDDLDARTNEQLREAASGRALLMELTLRNLATVAESMASYLEVNPDMSEAQIYEQLRRNTLQNPAIYGSALAFEEGVFPRRRLFSPSVYRSGSSKQENLKLKQLDIAKVYDYRKSDWFRNPKQLGRAVWVEPHADKGAGDIVMSTFAVPFYRDGKLGGVVTVKIDLPKLNSTLRWRNAPNSQSFIIAHSGAYVYHSNAKLIKYGSLARDAQGGDRSLQDLFRAMQSGQQGIMEVLWNGQYDYVAYSPISPAGWSFGVRSPQALSYAPAYFELRALVLGVSFILLIILTIVYVAVGGFLRPIGEFNRAAQQIAQGELDITLDTRRSDELGKLAVAFTDMAARVRVREVALSASHGDRLAQLLEGLQGQLFYYSLNSNGGVEYVSPAVENVLGYSPDEFKALFPNLLTESDINVTAKGYHRSALVGGSPPIYEVEYLHRDGTKRRGEVCERPLLDASGQIVSIEGLSSDVTERVRAVEWFRNLIEAAPDGIVITDQNERILLVNRQTEQIFGYTRDELIGQSAEVLRPKHLRLNRPDWNWNTLELNRLAEGDAMAELYGQHSSGTAFPVEISQQPLLLDNQWGELVSTSVRDVTSRRQAERELRENQQRVEMAATAGGLTFIDWDVTTGECWLKGYLVGVLVMGDGERISSADLEKRIVPEDRGRVEAEFQAFAQSNTRDYNISYRISGQRDEIHWLEIWGWVVRGATGLPERISAVMLDVTQQKTAEAKLQQINEQLAERTAELAQALGHTTSRLQGIMDNSPAAIWAKDTNGVYLFANDAYRTLFSVDVEEIVGNTDNLFFPRATANQFRRNDRIVIETGETSTFVELVDISNGVKSVLSVKFPLFNDAGKVYAAAGMCLDITDQLRMQDELKALNEELELRVEQRTNELSQAYEALSQSESRLSKATKNAPSLIFQYVLRPNGTAYIPYASAWIETYCGLRADDVREDAAPLLKLFHPDDFRGYHEAMRRAGAARSLFHHEWRFLFPDGRVTWAQVTARPEFLADGNILWSGVLMDITDRKKTEQVLAEREAEFRSLVDNIPGVVYRCSVAEDWPLNFVSDAIEQLSGYAPEDILNSGGRTFISFFHPEDVRETVRRITVAMRENRPYELGFRMLHRDGTLRWVYGKGQAVRDENGNAVYLIGNLFDNTQRKLAEDALAESQAHLQGVMDNSPGLIYLKDLQGRYLLVNPPWETIFGLKPEATIGHTDLELFEHDIAKAFSERDEWVMQNRKSQTYEEKVLLNGEFRYFVSSKFPVFDSEGEPFALCGISTDITESRRAESALRDSEARFKNILDGMQGGYLRSDMDWNVQFINPGMARILGYDSPDELMGKNVCQDVMLDPESCIELKDILARDGEVENYEMVFKRKDGSPVYVEDSAHLLWDGSGNLTGIEGLVRDVTERRQVEEALRLAKQAADESNQAKSDFLANMSHEIRTPMNGILGMSHLALQTELTLPQRNYLQKIDISARNLLSLINDILDFSKIEAGKLHIEKIAFNLEDVFHHISDIFAEKAADKRVEFHFRRETGVPIFLVGDPLRIGQVLMNLTSNALKFTETGEVEVSVHKIIEDDNSTKLCFSVRDTGIGLTEAQSSRLFQAFSQADTSITRKYGGTGLGLNICRSLVVMMGGSIWVESEPGVGSIFSFTVDLVEQQIPTVTQASDIESLSGKRALIVDDNSTSRLMLEGVLEGFHFEVTQAASGAEGLDIWRNSEQEFDLILLDWEMPEMDGIEVARRLRQMKHLRVPPIIMISAYERDEVMRQATDVGVNSFQIKPVNPSLLLDTIMHVFGKDKPYWFRESRLPQGGQRYAYLEGKQVLVVEDNDINQEIARGILQNAGIEVTVVDDGEQAVAAVRAAADKGTQYDAVLMDCQMPVLDGYSATRLIRQDLRFAELPIIAMTANAMIGDREKCLDAGMNDHVTKPIDLDELFAALERWIIGEDVPLQIVGGQSGSTAVWMGDTIDAVVPNVAPTSAVSPGTESADTGPFVIPGVDSEKGLYLVGGNRTLYRSLLTRFCEGRAQDVVEIRAAYEANDRELATRIAHSLKGVAGNIGAQGVFEAARIVENSLHTNETENLEEALMNLSAELDPVIQAILEQRQSQTTVETLTEPSAAPAAEAAPLDMAAIGPLLEQLAIYLNEQDTRAVDVCLELQPLLSGEAVTALDSITRAVNGYDFKTAENFSAVLQGIIGSGVISE